MFTSMLRPDWGRRQWRHERHPVRFQPVNNAHIWLIVYYSQTASLRCKSVTGLTLTVTLSPNAATTLMSVGRSWWTKHAFEIKTDEFEVDVINQQLHFRWILAKMSELTWCRRFRSARWLLGVTGEGGYTLQGLYTSRSRSRIFIVV